MTGFDFAAALEGLLLGAGLIIAIDVQNAFVLRQGLLRQHVLPVALVCSFADALLIAAGVGGFGRLVQTVPLLLTIFTALRRRCLPERVASRRPPGIRRG
jgi:L-lysine exporter family protein LysE/ArgO